MNPLLDEQRTLKFPNLSHHGPSTLLPVNEFSNHGMSPQPFRHQQEGMTDYYQVPRFDRGRMADYY